MHMQRIEPPPARDRYGELKSLPTKNIRIESRDRYATENI